MTTHISLNNQTFWTPPLSQPAQLRRVHPPRPLATQSRANTPPVSGQNALLTNDWMVISSDEDSDVTESDDDKTNAEDHLPSIAEIVSGLEKEERSRSNAAGEHPLILIGRLWLTSSGLCSCCCAGSDGCPKR
jgi:hypothetical protein